MSRHVILKATACMLLLASPAEAQRVFLNPSDQIHNPVTGGGNEAQYALINANRARDKIAANGFTVIVDQDFRGAPGHANSWGADIFISIHSNAGGGHGTETLYTTNAGRVLSGHIQEGLLGQYNFGDRGLRERNDLHVLNNTAMPAALTEVVFHDCVRNHPPTEPEFLRSDHGQDLISTGLSNGVCIHYNRECNGGEPPPPRSGLYKGVVYRNPDSADRIEGATVRLDNGMEQRTDGNGYFEFNVEAGRYTATATAQGFAPGSSTRDVPANGEVWGSIGLNPVGEPDSGQYKGVVYVDPDPEDRIGGASVSLNTGQQTRSREDGYWAFVVPAGRYTATATAQGFQPGSSTRDVPANGEVWGSIGLRRSQPDDPDADGDGHRRSTDCDDGDRNVHPGAPERCNGADDNCNGEVDEGDPESNAACDTGAHGVCSQGLRRCRAGELVCEPRVEPSDEQCGDELDNDCDGVIDNGCECGEGETMPCGLDRPPCESGTRTCRDGSWGPCEGAVGPDEESCNGLDDDCDGEIDEGCDCLAGLTEPCGQDAGECRSGTRICLDGRWGPCEGELGPEEEICDGLDNDCDGWTDEGCDCEAGEEQKCGSEIGECSPGTQVCRDGSWGSCMGEVPPSPEICDTRDNDCDDEVDEGCLCMDGSMSRCGEGERDCWTGLSRCEDGQWGACEDGILDVPERCSDPDAGAGGHPDAAPFAGADTPGTGGCQAAGGQTSSLLWLLLGLVCLVRPGRGRSC